MKALSIYKEKGAEISRQEKKKKKFLLNFSSLMCGTERRVTQADQKDQLSGKASVAQKSIVYHQYTCAIAGLNGRRWNRVVECTQ